MPVNVSARPPGGRVRPGMLAVGHYGQVYVVRAYNPQRRWFTLQTFRASGQIQPGRDVCRSWNERGVIYRRMTRNDFRGWVMPDAE